MAGDLHSFYAGKRVLVTGHTGFKGTWLSSWLYAMGARLAGYSYAGASGGFFDRTGLVRRMACYDADVRNAGTLRAVFKEFQPEIVLHLAAQPLVLTSYEQPVFTFESNVMGTVNVLDAAQHAPSVRAVVVVTTDKVYRNIESDRGYKESDELGGHDPYAASKAAVEIVVESFRKSFFDKPGSALLATVRAGNVIGGGDWAANRIVPDCVRSLSSQETIRVRNPGAIRPWQHVLEPLRGYLMVAKRLYEGDRQIAEPFNFGPPVESQVSVLNLVKKIISCWGSGSFKVDAQVDAPVETRALHLDITKSASVLGWVPRLTFDETVAMTIREYRDIVKDPNAAASMMAESIAEFELA